MRFRRVELPQYRSGRIYRDFLGQMNQKIARIADRVVLMIAGVPVTIKGSNAYQSKSETSDARWEAGGSRAPANGARKSQFRSQEMLK